MKRTVITMMAAIAAFSLWAEDGIAFGEPGTAHWTNASGDNCWTNPANWAEGMVPGRFVCSFETNTDLWRDDLPMYGVAGCTAVFDADAVSEDSVVRLDGLCSISNVVIVGASSRSFAFGTSDEPALPIERGGCIWVREMVTASPVLRAELAPGAGGAGGSYAFYLRNDSAASLEMYNIGAVKSFQVPAGWTVLTQTLLGTGDVRRNAHFYTDGFAVNLALAMSGGTYRPNSAMASIQNGYTSLTAEDNGFLQNIRIDEGKLLYVNANGEWDRAIWAKGDLLIGGAGELRVSGRDRAAHFAVDAGKTLTIECNIGLFEGAYGYALDGRSAGVLAMNGNFRAAANPSVPAGTLQVSRIGASGTDSPLGTGDGVTLAGGTLRYAGSGEITDRVLTLAKPSTLEQGGSGDLVLTAAPCGDSALTVRNVGSAAAVAFATSVATPLVLASDAHLAAVCQNGAGTAEIAFSSLVLTAGANVLRVDKGVSLTVGALTGGGEASTLDVAGDGTVKLAGFASGLLPPWLTRNGERGKVNAVGEVGAIGSVDRKIDARGGVILNAPGEVVAIATANGDTVGVSLAENETEVLALRQAQSVEPALVVVDAGQTFAPAMIEIAEGAQPLMLVGDGTVAPFALKGDGVMRTNTASGAGIRLSGDGFATVALNGAMTDGSPLDLKVSDGTVGLIGTGSVPAKFAVTDGGTLTWTGGSFIQTGLNLGDSSDPSPALFVGTNGVGTLEIDGGNWAGRLAVATDGGTGAVIQRGGEVVNVSGTDGEIKWFGVNGHGFYELSGGRFVSAGASLLGQGGVGIFNICGGTLTCTPSSERRMGTWTLGGWEGAAVVTVGDGGKIDFTDSGAGAGQAVILAPYYGRWRTEAVFTVEDGGEVDLGSGVYCGGYGNSDVYRPSVVNLNGGTFRAHSISRPRDTVYPSAAFPNGKATDANYANCPVYVNFDGGTFRPTSWAGVFGANTDTAAQPPTRVTVFAGGATIDTTGVDCEVSVGSGLMSPTGKGVASIALDDAVRSRTFAAPPHVRIVGDGSGATAVVVFDSVSRRVTGIRVTCPGWDYGTAEAQLIVGKSMVATLSATLAENVSGGLTKTGLGTLRIAATNTFTGATRVCAGTLRLLADNAFSESSALVLDGGRLDVNGHSQTFSDITCGGGSVVDGDSVGRVDLSGLTVDFASAATGTVKCVDESFFRFADGATLSVENFDPTQIGHARRLYALVRFSKSVPPGLCLPTLDLPEGWRLKVRGRQICLVREWGTMLIVR